MSKWILTPAFALALAGMAFGQVQATSGTNDDLDPRPGTREIRLSGEIDFNLAFQSREVAEVADETGRGWANAVDPDWDGAANLGFGAGSGGVPAAGAADADDDGDGVADGADAVHAGPDFGGREDRTFAYGKVILRTVAVVSDNVRGTIELWIPTRGTVDGRTTTWGGGRGAGTYSYLAVMLRSAYIDLTEVIDPSIRLRLGLQDVDVRLRGDREGAMAYDLRNATSPWYGINHRQPMTYRTLNEPVGAWLNWQYDSLMLDVWAIPVLNHQGGPGTVFGGQSARENEQFYALQFTYKLPSIGSRTGHHPWRAQYEHVSRITAHVAHLAGGTTNTVGGSQFTPGINAGFPVIRARGASIVNLGLGVDLVDIGGSGLELWAEGVANLGSAGRTSGIPFAESIYSDSLPIRNLRARGLAFQVGGRYDYRGETFNWWLQAKFNHYSGDNNAGDTNWAGFIGYGNQADFIVIEDKDVGFGLNSNLQALKFQGGFDLQIVQAPRRLMIDLGLGFFRTHQSIPLRGTVAITGQRRSNRLGTEFDAKLTYVLNESVQFRGTVGYLIRPDALRRFTQSQAVNGTVGRRRDAWIVSLGFDYRY